MKFLSTEIKPDHWIDPIVKILSYASLCGKMSRKQRLDKFGILKTVEISTNMNSTELSFWLEDFSRYAQRYSKTLKNKAKEENEKERDFEESKDMKTVIVVSKEDALPGGED